MCELQKVDSDITIDDFIALKYTDVYFEGKIQIQSNPCQIDYRYIEVVLVLKRDHGSPPPESGLETDLIAGWSETTWSPISQIVHSCVGKCLQILV